MRTNAFQFLGLLAGLIMLGCGGSSSPCPDGEVECTNTSGEMECIPACDSGEVECDCTCIPDFEPTLADIQTSVFDISCTFSDCHGDTNPQAGLELSDVQASEANLIDVESTQVMGRDRVVPGSITESYLWDKLTDTNIAPGTQPMPLGGFPLCDVKLEVVEVWISEGAPIN